MEYRHILKMADDRLGRPLGRFSSAYWTINVISLARAQVDWLKFYRAKYERLARYRAFSAAAKSYDAVLRGLRTDGYAIIRGALPTATLLSLREEFDRNLALGRYVDVVSHDALRKKGDTQSPKHYLADEELGRGEPYFRYLTNNVQLNTLFTACPSALGIAFQEMLIDISVGYLGSFPLLGTMNLRRSYANGLAEFDTNYFHCDPNSPRFLKFFFYLNDVDEDGGPFCFVRGSHVKKFWGWRKKYRWAHDEIEKVYGARHILKLTAKVGDMIVADTTGFHRGTKATSNDRTMFTVNYLLHPEFNGEGVTWLTQGQYDGLTPRQQAVACLEKSFGSSEHTQEIRHG